MIRPDEWRPVAGVVLERNAHATATMTGGNAAVTAGPGAGKTELLAQRADFLLRTGTCRYPRRILAICFKVDAAANLRARVRTRSGDRYAARLDSLTFHAFAKRLIDNYRAALTGAQALSADYRIVSKKPEVGKEITYDELIPRALTILNTDPYALRALRQTFSHVFLDEFQDATKPQYELLKTAFHGTDTSVVAVGDVKQRIMGWAGALDGVFEQFVDDFQAAPRSLYQNFRSAPRLRRMQNRMILKMDPDAASPDEDLTGDAGRVEVLRADTEADEAEAIASLIDQWLANGVPAPEIAVLVRQHAGPVTTDLRAQLRERGIPYRDEQGAQDLTAEPIGSLIFNFIRVVAEDRQPAAYAELMRLVRKTSVLEETATRFDRSAQRLIQACRTQVREPHFQPERLASWKPLLDRFLELVSRPSLMAMSTGYQQGSRLDELVEDVVRTFGNELESDGDPSAALRRLSEKDAVRILTVHKCKGLEFTKVVVLGVEREFYWSDDSLPVFFVAISRAKDELILTHVDKRVCPPVQVRRWDEPRRPHTVLLGFADEA